MTTGIYRGMSVSDLLSMKQDVLDQLELVRKGTQVVSTSVGGKSVTKTLPNLEELKTELEEIQLALKKADPDTYGKVRRRFAIDFRQRKI